ncbi:MAG TPA: 50S ribosomal protein L29 [Blastocatellia bacterium]|nr:50S ribosomal protein L29 [Blastocatellia bacterium]
MKINMDDVRKLSTEDLAKRELELRESLFRLNFKKVLGDIDTVGQIRRHKKELARVKTILNARALGIEQ